MVYTINVDYPHAWHVPSNTLSPVIGVISAHSIALKKQSLTHLVNEIFAGNDREVFGKNDNLIHNEPAEVILVNSRLSKEDLQRLDLIFCDNTKVKSSSLCR